MNTQTSSSFPTRLADARAIGVLSTVLGVASTCLVVSVMALVVVDVTVRNTTGGSVPGVLEISEISLVGIVYLGLAIAQRRDEHVSLSFFVDRLPERWKRFFYAVACVVSILLVAWFCWATSLAAIDSFKRGEYRFGIVEVIIWPARIAVAIGFVALLLELLVDLRRILGGAPLEQPIPSSADSL